MTERFEITSILQRLLVAQKSIFGDVVRGTPESPAVVKSSVHHLSKVVAGRQLRRPWWFFDTSVQGEGLVDITTHLVDLVFWTLFPDQPIDYGTEIGISAAKHWPTILTPEQYSRVTGETRFQEQFRPDGKGCYPYFCNGRTDFHVRGVHVRAEVVWNFEAPEGAGDTHYSIINGTRAKVIVLQGKEQNFKPELYVETAGGSDPAVVGLELERFIAKLDNYPGIAVVREENRWRIDIPDVYRVGHEAHFGQVTDRFLEFLGGALLPEWEKANMLAKYYVTTKSLELCRERE
jgi:hypothetical protein